MVVKLSQTIALCFVINRSSDEILTVISNGKTHSWVGIISSKYVPIGSKSVARIEFRGNDIY